MSQRYLLASVVLLGWLAAGSSTWAGDRLRLLIVDGQHHPAHDWRATTPWMKRLLEESGRFSVEVATSPPKGDDMSSFSPQFADYDVVLANYDGDSWQNTTQASFSRFVRQGGGFVCVHGAGNAFPDWPQYNEMCGLSGWQERDERSGPYVYYRNDKLVRDTSPGPGGHHGPKHQFPIKLRDAEHPITRGLPPVWMHAKDELYDRLRGPAKNLHILATAYSDPAQEGTGRDEPMLMTIEYQQGRIFHTTLGHDVFSMRCVGFVTTLLRGAEWAATGKVTLPVPDDFPSADEPRSRD